MWTKLGDEFVDEAADLTDAAVRTFIDLVAWSNRRGLDLTIPKRDLRRCAFSDDADTAIAELVDCGWLVDGGQAWTVTHHPEWQQSKAQVDSRREKNRRNQAHRRGDHQYCTPDNCNTLSPADTLTDNADDTPDDSVGDPGLVGTGRDRQLRQPPTEDAWVA